MTTNQEKKGLLNPKFVRLLNHTTYYVLTPLLVVVGITGAILADQLEWHKFVFFVSIGVAMCFAGFFLAFQDFPIAQYFGFPYEKFPLVRGFGIALMLAGFLVMVNNAEEHHSFDGYFAENRPEPFFPWPYPLKQQTFYPAGNDLSNTQLHNMMNGYMDELFGGAVGNYVSDNIKGLNDTAHKIHPELGKVFDYQMVPVVELLDNHVAADQAEAK